MPLILFWMELSRSPEINVPWVGATNSEAWTLFRRPARVLTKSPVKTEPSEYECICIHITPVNHTVYLWNTRAARIPVQVRSSLCACWCIVAFVFSPSWFDGARNENAVILFFIGGKISLCRCDLIMAIISMLNLALKVAGGCYLIRITKLNLFRFLSILILISPNSIIVKWKIWNPPLDKRLLKSD